MSNIKCVVSERVKGLLNQEDMVLENASGVKLVIFSAMWERVNKDMDMDKDTDTDTDMDTDLTLTSFQKFMLSSF